MRIHSIAITIDSSVRTTMTISVEVPRFSRESNAVVQEWVVSISEGGRHGRVCRIGDPMELGEDDRDGVLDNQGDTERHAVLDDHINLEHHYQGHQLHNRSCLVQGGKRDENRYTH